MDQKYTAYFSGSSHWPCKSTSLCMYARLMFDYNIKYYKFFIPERNSGQNVLRYIYICIKMERRKISDSVIYSFRSKLSRYKKSKLLPFFTGTSTNFDMSCSSDDLVKMVSGPSGLGLWIINRVIKKIFPLECLN